MANMKAIKRRRLTVKNISQITNAMNLVATSKLQRARNALAMASDPILATFDIVYQTVSHPQALGAEGLAPREGGARKTAYVVVTGNRGLCGGYHANVCKAMIAHASAHGKQPVIIPFGSKGRDYLQRRGYEVMEYPTPQEHPSFEDARELSALLTGLYTGGEVDEVYIAYTKFVTVLNLEPIVRQILPLDPAYLRLVLADDLAPGEAWEDLGFFLKPEPKLRAGDYVEFEPDLETVVAHVIPWYMHMYIHGAFTAAYLCEQAARMTSMDASTKNAADIIEKLTLQYNRQRQSIITQEITEIVSGANALQ